MRERVVVFGQDRGLVGILSEPARPGRQGAPAVILLTAGLVHRIGPNRLYVLLARELGRRGFRTLRFDMRGVGDSFLLEREVSLEAQAHEDIRDAMGYLERIGISERFVLAGLCSGADNSWQVAVRDPRVMGCVLMDGYGYRTFGYYVRYYGSHCLSPGSWLRLGSRLMNHVRRLPGRKVALAPMVPDFRKFPTLAEARSQLASLMVRKVKMLVVFSGGVDFYYNYEAQFAHAFRTVEFDDLVDVVYNKAADHTYTLGADRERIVMTISDWLERGFPALESIRKNR